MSETTLSNGKGTQAGMVDFLQDYYGKKLKTNADFKEKACCTTETSQKYGDILKLIPKEVTEKHYGCGVPIPEDDLTGLTVLDLGSGSGVDVFIMAHRVGEKGFVYGIDITPEQIDVAQKNTSKIMENFKYRKSNVAFHKDLIEKADSIPDNSVDLVISDCVINLSPRKDLVFSTIQRILKPGGEFYISDITSDRRIPEEIAKDPVMVAECLGGAEYIHDWFDIMKAAGFPDPRTVSTRLMQSDANGVPITFWSATVRGFKLNPVLENRCEDYGQIATYKGTLEGLSSKFILDDRHTFEAKRPMAVCRNTARMLSETRLSKHFNVTLPIQHFGLFDCSPKTSSDQTTSSGACC